MKSELHRPEFKFLVEMFCPCGYMMQITEVGAYCENPLCVLRVNLYRITVAAHEVRELDS